MHGKLGNGTVEFSLTAFYISIIDSFFFFVSNLQNKPKSTNPLNSKNPKLDEAYVFRTKTRGGRTK